jgi:hypothetical protein
MKEELEQELIKKYPKLFRDSSLPPTQTLICFGCDCGDGWYKILDHLFGYLTDLMERKLVVDYTKEYKDQHRDKKDFYEKYCSYKFLPPQIILDQVKEKWGCLRVYNHTDFEDIPEEVWAVLDLKEFYKKMDEYSDRIDHAIEYAEYQSSRTCEITGKEGKLYTKGWYRVLCDEEAIKKGYKPEEDGEKFIIENL